MSHVLIVEDEKDIAELIKSQLTSIGHEVDIISDGAQALEVIQSQESAPYDLYILDRMLPGNSGLEICQFLRMYKETKTKPILMVTAMTTPEHIVEGLDAGADDYLTKPFDITVLLARVRSLLRRVEQLSSQFQQAESNASSTLEIKNLKVDTDQCKTWLDGEELELTLSEYKILVSFMQNPGKVLTRNQLVEFIQDGPIHVTDRTIDTHIFGLRKKLKGQASMIETIRGVGYRVIND